MIVGSFVEVDYGDGRPTFEVEMFDGPGSSKVDLYLQYPPNWNARAGLERYAEEQMDILSRWHENRAAVSLPPIPLVSYMYGIPHPDDV